MCVKYCVSYFASKYLSYTYFGTVHDLLNRINKISYFICVNNYDLFL